MQQRNDSESGDMSVHCILSHRTISDTETRIQNEIGLCPNVQVGFRQTFIHYMCLTLEKQWQK